MLHVWHAHMNKSVPSSPKQQREITIGPFIREEIRRVLCKARLIFSRINGPNVYRFDDNLGIQLYSFNFLYLISRRINESSYSVLCQNYRTRAR